MKKAVKNIFLCLEKRKQSEIYFAICLAALLLAAPKGLFAQDSASNSAPSAQVDSVNTKSTDNQYRIGIGDVLDIRIFNRPQLSRDAIRVDGRGMIRMPLLTGEIKAACQTETELAREITARYLEYLRNPHVDVFIKDYQSKPVAVIGAVHQPGRFQMQRRVRLLELLSFAGGPTEQAGGRIQVKHEPDQLICEQTGDSVPADNKADAGELIDWYDVKALMDNNGSEETNPYVRPGDVVNLLEADSAFVVGNVVKPSAIPLKDRITVSQAIAMAGGTLPDTNLDKVTIRRQAVGGTTKTEIIVDLKAINQRKAEDFVLQANDIVDVPTSGSKKFMRGLINSIAPTASRAGVRIIP